ncbi:hypothetical protein [Lyngbya sp. CCY1209]|uniref:fascin domain-containing protein n=1 Tax=Lyngbya sp. CCY1209 TaxID=2886103 RepID=UPI002D201523|nr:hypothetical protein [Lyngbya sp. CCY1209]MEB3883084.1 hypothetical protein [Lyngbya sp. CCY1209]
MPGIKIALKADTGNYLSRCNNCIPGGAYPDSAFVHVTELAGSPWAHWEIEHLDNGKYILKADTGNYLSRCNNCIPGGAYPDSVFVHVTDAASTPAAQWEIERLDNGKYAFKANTGNYMSRCNNCISGGAYPDSVFVHVADAASTPAAQWEIIFLP